MRIFRSKIDQLPATDFVQQPEPESKNEAEKRVLNTGSGPAARYKLHTTFHGEDWSEVRLDIDPAVKPDLIGSIVDMKSIVPDASFDAVWSSHNVEHLYNHEVIPSFAEFNRVLKPTGFALITCPDIAAVAKMVLEKGLDHMAYVSPAGPVHLVDMLFGFSPSIAVGNYYMAHHTGFTTDRLGRCFSEAGFDEVWVTEGENMDLWCVALKPEADRDGIRKLLENTSAAKLLN